MELLESVTPGAEVGTPSPKTIPVTPTFLNHLLVALRHMNISYIAMKSKGKI